MPEEELRLVNDHGRFTALERSREVALKLAATARRLRFSTSNRSNHFKEVGLRPRFLDSVFKWILLGSAVLLFLLPNSAAIFYFGYLASDQFQSETRFTVRSSTPALGKDQIGKATGIPAAKIVQDTQIITDYVTSTAMVRILERNLDLRAIYGRQSIDVLSRLKADSTSEDVTKYWQSMISTSISPSSGIVIVKVRAFTAEEAQRVIREVISASESIVNDINDRIWRDVTATAQENLDRAAQQLKQAREQLQEARNQSGVLSVAGTSSVINSLISNVERERLSLLQKYESQLGSISKDAPQMRVLSREIASKEAQIRELQGQLAGQREASTNLADIAVSISQRELEQGLAEQQFASSVKTMEQIKFVSRQQLLYLDAFLLPEIPDAPKYPKRVFWIIATFVSSIVMWLTFVGILSTVRARLH